MRRDKNTERKWADRIIYSPSGKPFGAPPEVSGGVDLGIIFFPKYRLFISYDAA
jgi:hypothetical protein